MTVAEAGDALMLIVPAHMHMHVESVVSAGLLAIIVCAAPGVHGAVTAGMHGIGVSTPSAADVAAMTTGLDGDWHIPNVAMFIMGIWSMIVAAGWLPAITIAVGKTVSDAGATPIVHDIIAVPTTS